MTNPYGLVLDDASLRWATAESVPETVTAAICLLETRSVDEIVARLTPAELEQVIKIVGRCPRGYTPGAPSQRFAGLGAKGPLSATQRATANRYGITLDPTWTEWAAECGVSETIAAALYLISRNSKAGEVVVKLTPGEIERVIDPDRFPPGAVAALNHSRSAPPPEQSAACTSPGAGRRPVARVNSSVGQLHSNGPARPGAAVRSTPERGPARPGAAVRSTFWRSCGRSTQRSTSSAWSSLHWFNRPSLAGLRRSSGNTHLKKS